MRRVEEAKEKEEKEGEGGRRRRKGRGKEGHANLVKGLDQRSPDLGREGGHGRGHPEADMVSVQVHDHHVVLQSESFARRVRPQEADDEGEGRSEVFNHVSREERDEHVLLKQGGSGWKESRKHHREVGEGFKKKERREKEGRRRRERR
jgi:hypothetical protein